MKMKILIFPLALILLTLAGCSTMKPLKKETFTKAPLPVSRILRRVEAERRKIKTFRASGTIDFTGQRFSGKGEIEILIKKPDSLKILIFGPFGIELGEALVTHENFFFYDAFKNRLFKGRNSEKAIEKIFKIKYSFQELLDALTGYANLTNDLYKTPDSVERNGDWFSVKFVNKAEPTMRIFKIALDDYRVLLYSLVQGPNNLIVQNKFADFKRINNINVPHQVRITYRKKSKVKLTYRSVKINEEIKSLKLDVPEDAKIIRW